MKERFIQGQVISREARRPLSGLQVEAWIQAEDGGKALGSATSGTSGHFRIAIDEALFKKLTAGGRRVKVGFKVLLGGKLVADVKDLPTWNASMARAGIVLPVSQAAVDRAKAGLTFFEIRGQVTDERGVAVAGVQVEVSDQRLGGDAVLGTTFTDARGRYEVSYDPTSLKGKAQADVRVRVLNKTPGADRRELGTSKVVYEAGAREAIDVSIRTRDVPRTTEYERLVDAVEPVLGDELAAADLSTTGVSHVSNKSGWDARAVAMAAQAATLSKDTGIPASHYYALFRSGVAGDHASVSRLSTAALERSLRAAVEKGIISGEDSIEATLERHRKQGVEFLGGFQLEGAISSLGEMLGLRLDDADRARFLRSYQQAGDEPERLWAALAQEGFDGDTIKKLQTDGKLGYLTLQNRPLIARLHQTDGFTEASDLARLGLYRADAWLELVGDDVPEGITRDAYAAGLAAQVNRSYPTLVVAELMRRREVRIGDQVAQAEVSDFMRANHSRHTVGSQPIKTWEGYDQLSPDARAGARLLERMYQISPSNESMEALSKLGIDSAYQVMHFSFEGFMAKFAAEFPSRAEAEKVYYKAQQVHATTLSLTTSYLTYRIAPNVYSISGRNGALSLERSLSRSISPPALEELFGGMDYCACEHCKSVLGPAAYLVELLQFIDLSEVPHDGSNPIEVLAQRRPDLQHILLSCENTNVALPYVDIVNEVLEHYVVNGNLAAFSGFNMREDSQAADLLADPQFVLNEAYDATRSEVYPWGLPFDMPLEALRRLFASMDISLVDAWRTFGSVVDARREILGFNAGEYSILTDKTFRALPEYFGEPPGASMAALNAAVADGKSFSRRTGIEHRELVELLQTKFINPGVSLLPALNQLRTSLTVIQSWFDGGTSDGELLAGFPAGLDLSEYGGDVLGWLTDNRELIMGLVTLTHVDTESDACDFSNLELRLALPDMTANALTALHYHKLLRFIRLWKKLGHGLELTDLLVTTFLDTSPQDLTLLNLDQSFQTLLARIANFIRLADRLSISKKKLEEWLRIWDGSQSLPARQARLARLLRIGLTDMLDLAEMTGLDPLANDMETDEPSLIEFVDRYEALKGRRLKVADLNYVLRHKDDSGKLVPTELSLLRDLKALRDGLTAVDIETSLTPDNADLAHAQARMALVYDAGVVERFFGLVDRTSTYSAPLQMAEETLPQKLIDAGPRLDYDPFARTLTFTGILSASEHAALNAAADSLVLADVDVIDSQSELDAFIADFKTATQGLFDAGDADLQQLNAEYPELKTLYDALQALSDPEEKTTLVLESILPELRGQLKTTFLHTTLAKLLKADLPVVEALVVSTHAHSDPGQGVLSDFFGLESPVALDADGDHDFYLDPPSMDDYILYVRAPENTTVTLTLDGDIVLPATAVGVSGEVQTTAPIALGIGVPVAARLSLAGLPAGESAVLLWRTKGMAKQRIPAARLYASSSVVEARASLLRLQKASLLRRLLALTPREVVHFATEQPTTQSFIDDLDIDGGIAAPDLHNLSRKVAWLTWFAGLKEETEPDENTWVQILEQPDLQAPPGQLLLTGVNGWKLVDLNSVLAHFGLALGDLSALSNLRRVIRAMELVTAAGYPGADLVTWSTGTPDAALVESVKAAIRSRLDDGPWRETMQAVNDDLRNRRRDALVSYILHHQPPAPSVDTPDRLYEHFLLDVQMDACRQTSRIRNALSTVQLFINRCLMNLEPEVSPASIREDRWQWMKRYRVWEANRKVFLYPENWLEPELRDNKSPFFRELESELLKSDITQELAEDAYFGYLKKLDDVARLDIAGSYLEERTPGNQDDDVLHVFGRTNGNTRQHYYRRFEGGYWTPWEKVSLNIEGDLLLPVVWKSRLYVFWFNALDKPEAGSEGKTPEQMAGDPWTNSARKTVEITLGWGEYFKGKWTSPKSSEMNAPIRIRDVRRFEPEKLVVAARTHKPSANVSERLILGLLYLGGTGSLDAYKVTLTSKNSAPIIEPDVDGELLLDVQLFNYVLLWQPNNAPGKPALLEHNSLLVRSNLFKVEITQPPQATASSLEQTLLTKTGLLHPTFRLRPVLQDSENEWEAPIVYSDEHSTFFVTGDERLRTVPAIEHYPGYYWLGPQVAEAEILPKMPPLYERPEIPPDPLGPWVNPWEDFVQNAAPNTRVVLTDSATFHYRGADYGAAGIMNDFRGVGRR